VWQHLQQRLLSDIGQEHLYHNSESVVPATLVYLLSEYEKSTLQPLHNQIQKKANEGILNIHLIGATYLFEGLSDWKVLAEWVPSYIRTIRIHLILGSPFQEDGPSQDEQGRSITEEVPDDLQGQVPMQVSLLSTRSQRRHQRSLRKPKIWKLHAQDLRKKSCGSHYFNTTGVKLVVKCHERLYQDVWDIIPQPNVALMINPGFPLPNRRSFDGVLQHLLNASIPTAVSAQQVVGGVSTVPWKNERTRGAKLKLKKNFSDEAYQIFKTLQMYEAQVVATSSPFPYLYELEVDDGVKVIKNNVIEFFVGRKPGATTLKMLRRMREGKHRHHKNADKFEID
jgi:hypothetical protein